ncbi:TIGR02679 family protein [Streptomyces olivoreticuli]
MPTERQERQGHEAYEELRGEGWTRLLAAARRKLERTSGTLDGQISLTTPGETERRTIIKITGRYRPETAKRLTIPLTDLDTYLHNRFGTGLPQTIALLSGPLRDRPAEHAHEETHRTQALQSAHTSRLASQDWYERWLEAITADGTLTRLVRRGDTLLLDMAVRVLENLPEDPSRIIPLPVLAERATGDTKALTPGTPLEQLVLRALAQRTGSDVPRERTGRRTLWESTGAIADDLASQVLVLRIRPIGDTAVCHWLRDAADSNIPFRLTLHQLTLAPVVAADRDIYVCENPAVLRAAAELKGESAALVCTEGIPSAACHKLLGDAARAGTRLHWRADFDWTGLRITAAAMKRHGARPWRMTTADYRKALGQGQSTPLTGPPAHSPWDPHLAQTMRNTGTSVMEERLLPQLLLDLTGP